MKKSSKSTAKKVVKKAGSPKKKKAANKKGKRKRYGRRPLPVNFQFPDASQRPPVSLPAIRLTGNDVELLHLRTSDIPDLEKAAKKTKIFKWFIDGWLIIKGNVPAYVLHILHEDELGHSLSYAVYHRKSRRVVGVSRFYDIDPKHKTVSIATWYDEKFHASGVNTESKYLMLEYAFAAGFGRIEFEVDTRNLPSIKAMKGIGAKSEGIKESHMELPSGERRDSRVFSISKKRWETKVQRLLKRRLSRVY